MKKIIKTYRTFYPDFHPIVALIALPAIIIALVAVFGQKTGEIAFVVASTAYAFIDILSDYFVFNGLMHEKVGYRLLMTAFHGRKVLFSGVLLDQIIRLIKIAIFEIIIGSILRPYIPDINGAGNYGMFIAISIMLMFSIDSFALNITRRVEIFMVYGTLSTIVVAAYASCQLFVEMWASLAPSVLPLITSMLALITIIEGIASVYYSDSIYCMSFGNKQIELSKEEKTRNNKNKLWIFIGFAFGLTFVMDIFFKIGLDKGVDLTSLLAVQMMYPMCGVIVGKLVCDKFVMLPKSTMFTMLAASALMFENAILSVFMPVEYGTEAMPLYYLLANVWAMIGSVIVLVKLIFVDRKRAKNAGFDFPHVLKSIWLPLLFIVLYFVRMLINICISGLSTGQTGELLKSFGSIFASSNTYYMLLMLLINLPICFIMYLGEEYGWRYYFQPVLQEKFGLKAGTIILGVLWGIYHCGADFMYYSTTTGPQMLVAQIVTCVSIGIFMAYAYMKTQNVWVPVIIHFFNNNLLPIMAGDYSVGVMQGNVVSWSSILVAMIAAIPFVVFIFTKPFSKKAAVKEDKKEC